MSTTQTRDKKWVLDWEIHWLPSLKTVCSTDFLLHCLEARVAVWLHFYMGAIAEVLFLSELRLLMPHIEHPAGTRTYCTWFPLERQYHPVSLQLNRNIFICSVYSALNLMLRNLTLLCIFLFYASILRWDIFTKLSATFLPSHMLWQSISIEHGLFKNLHSSHIMTSLCETKHDCVSLIWHCVRRKDITDPDYFSSCLAQFLLVLLFTLILVYGGVRSVG